MNNLEKIADELVEKFESYAQYNRLTGDGIVKAKVLCAIQSVTYTIDSLEKVIQHDKERYGITSRGASI